jgi:hypothetical protein
MFLWLSVLLVALIVVLFGLFFWATLVLLRREQRKDIEDDGSERECGDDRERQLGPAHARRS